MKIRHGLPTALAVAAYGPSLGGRFVYDDRWTIVENGFVQNFANLFRFFSADYFAGVPDQTRPFMILTTMVDCALFRLAPLGHHVQSLLWHIAASLLVGAIARRVACSRAAALFASMLFAAHPGAVEAVACVSSREDVLATVFLCGGYLLLVHAKRTPNAAESWSGTVLLVCGVWSKETALVALPLFFLLRLALGVGLRDAALRAAKSELVPASLGFAAYASLLVWTHKHPSVAPALVPFFDRVSKSFAVLASYAAQLLGLGWASPEYSASFKPAEGLLAFASLAIGLGALFLVWSKRNRWRVACFSLTWTLVTLLPSANWLPIHNPRADRYLYAPLVGVCIAGGAGIAYLARATSLGKRGAWVLFAVIVVAFLPKVWLEARIWKDDLAVFSRAVETAEDSPRAWLGLARARLAKGQYAEAAAAAERGLALTAASGELQIARAEADIGLGRFDDADRRLASLRTGSPSLIEARSLATLALIREHQAQGHVAIELYRQAVSCHVREAEFRAELALALERQGRLDEARMEARRALAGSTLSVAARQRLEKLLGRSSPSSRRRSP